MKHWSPQRLIYPTILCFLCFINFFNTISTTIADHSLMVFYLQQVIHKNITQWFNSYAAMHGKEQHVRQNIICKIKDLEWLINMLSILSFKPYAKLISLSVIFLSPLRCASFINEATPSHDIPWPDCVHHSIHTFIQSRLFGWFHEDG